MLTIFSIHDPSVRGCRNVGNTPPKSLCATMEYGLAPGGIATYTWLIMFCAEFFDPTECRIVADASFLLIWTTSVSCVTMQTEIVGMPDFGEKSDIKAASLQCYQKRCIISQSRTNSPSFRISQLDNISPLFLAKQ
jgi:hypothetical protein